MGVMAHQWKPGDVASVPGVGRAFLANDGWHTISTPGLVRVPKADEFVSHRPLVVIDPEDREQVERLMFALWDADGDLFGKRNSDEWVTLLGDALRILVAPPKPDEPMGLGAVVEDAEGRKYIRTADVYCRKPWSYANNYTDTDWADIAAVKILSPGVTL